MSRFAKRIRPYVTAELDLAVAAQYSGDDLQCFRHLERAHILGQAATREHVRVHWAMLKWAFRKRLGREVAGQAFRIVGAATKTAVGLVPVGNTGGSNVSPFARAAVPADLAMKIAAAQSE